MSSLRLCSLDPPKYGWTACGGVSSILEPHEMARRQEAKDRYLNLQRGKDITPPFNDDAKSTNNDDDVFYTIVDPPPSSGVSTNVEGNTDVAATVGSGGNNEMDSLDSQPSKMSSIVLRETKDVPLEDVTDQNYDDINETTTCPPPSTSSSHQRQILDIYSYHRGRMGCEPRDKNTGELLCDTDPVDTNHFWVPPTKKKLVCAVTVRFPLVDDDDDVNDFDDSSEDDNRGEDGKEAEEKGEGENVPVNDDSPGESSRSVSFLPSDSMNKQQQKHSAKATSSMVVPHFVQVVDWDLTDPNVPTPEEYASRIASEFGLTFQQTMDLTKMICQQLDDYCTNLTKSVPGRHSMYSSTPFYAPLTIRDPYGMDRPDVHYGPPESEGLWFNAGGGGRADGIASSRGSGPSISRTNSTAGGLPQPRNATRIPAIKVDKQGIRVTAKDQTPIPNPNGDVHAAEVLRRVQAYSESIVSDRISKGEATITLVHGEVCHICHNRKKDLLTFHCGRHSYCDYHTSTRLSFRVKDYDPTTPLKVPITYCPVCTLRCTCSKCARRLDDVAAAMKRECKHQNCSSAEDVVMDGLHELCSAELKLFGGSAGIFKKKNETKKKVSRPKIEADDWGPPKSRRSFGSYDDGDGTDSPRHPNFRSTRSSPSMDDSDGRPSKKKKVLEGKKVLKIPPAAFPTELATGCKNLDPSTPQELNTIFTPDGSFLAENEDIAMTIKYQVLITYNPDIESNFFVCAVCGLENEDERVPCKNCPRSYHCKCIDESCFSPTKKNESIAEVDVIINDDSNHETQKRGCKRCELDTRILPEEDIPSGMDAVNNTEEKKKIDMVYKKYKDVSNSYNFASLILVELWQILNKLIAYDYGDIFSDPVDIDLVKDYLSIVSKPMDYNTIITKLENGGYEPSSSPSTDEHEPIDAMEEIVLYALMDTHQVHHNCLLYNQKGSVFYRAGSVQRNKFLAYFERHIQERLSNGVISRLHEFLGACKAEREQLTVRTRHFQSSVPPISGNKAIAVFDPDTRKIVKQYSSKVAGRTAALLLCQDGYACEWELTTSNVKNRMEMAEDPTRPLFGYQWIPTDKLKSGNFKIRPYFWNDNLASPTPHNIVVLKEDIVAGVRQVRGFESEEAAYQDWLNEKRMSLSSPDQDGSSEEQGLSYFVEYYLDGDKSINGNIWNRVLPHMEEVITSTQSSPGKVVMQEERAVMSPRKAKGEDELHTNIN